MSVYVVTRHNGAVDYLDAVGIQYDEIIPHLDLNQVQEGDVLIGSLPINMVEKLSSLGVRYVHLSLNIPPHMRGVELSKEQLLEFGATLQEFKVTLVGNYEV